MWDVRVADVSDLFQSHSFFRKVSSPKRGKSFTEQGFSFSITCTKRVLDALAHA